FPRCDNVRRSLRNGQRSIVLRSPHPLGSRGRGQVREGPPVHWHELPAQTPMGFSKRRILLPRIPRRRYPTQTKPNQMITSKDVLITAHSQKDGTVLVKAGF